jgi:hypothetical protein
MTFGELLCGSMESAYFYCALFGLIIGNVLSDFFKKVWLDAERGFQLEALPVTRERLAVAAFRGICAPDPSGEKQRHDGDLRFPILATRAWLGWGTRLPPERKQRYGGNFWFSSG